MNHDDTYNFYCNLPTIEDFFDASDEKNYHPLPEDWYVAITDIINSTDLLHKEQYKNVNILGASPIVGILNIAERNKIPYVFGGDGSAFCIPPQLLNETHNVLAACRQIGKEVYNLNLRAAIIPVSHLKQQGYHIKIARYRASEHYIQAFFSGGGISQAEVILKNSNLKKYRIAASDNAEEVDFSGLECRWQEVKQEGKEVITLLVASNPKKNPSDPVYSEVLQKLRDIFSFDNTSNPLDNTALHMNTSFSKLMGEVNFRTFGKGWFDKLLYLIKAELQILIGKLFMNMEYATSNTDWARYKTDMTRNSDYRKFDDMLRLVISGSTAQRRQLERFLEQQFENRNLAYGIHVTDAAVVTCMVFQYHREHIHFVDGSGGGYTLASKKLKKQLEILKEE